MSDCVKKLLIYHKSNLYFSPIIIFFKTANYLLCEISLRIWSKHRTTWLPVNQLLIVSESDLLSCSKLTCHLLKIVVSAKAINKPNQYHMLLFAFWWPRLAPWTMIPLDNSCTNRIKPRSHRTNWRQNSTQLTCIVVTRYPPKIRLLPSGTLPRTLNLENFATARNLVTFNKGECLAR